MPVAIRLAVSGTTDINPAVARLAAVRLCHKNGDRRKLPENSIFYSIISRQVKYGIFAIL